MRRITLAALLVIVGCSAAPVVSDTRVSSTTSSITSSTAPAGGSTITAPQSIGGQLVRLDPLTLEPVPGLDPIQHPVDSWNLVSGDGAFVVNFEWDAPSESIVAARTVDVQTWRRLADLELGAFGGSVFHKDTLYMYDSQSGALTASDLKSGKTETLAAWPRDRWPWDELHIVSGDRIAALVSSASGDVYGVLIYDPGLGSTTEISVGEIVRTNPDSGVFDGGYEIPDMDLPGVAWREDRLFVVHADDLEIIEVDLIEGTIHNHTIETATWWERLVGNWFPTAVAKGPSLGTRSSAALSADGRHLFISGNRITIEVSENGQLVDSSEHLGLTVVDLENWSKIDAPDLDMQYVRSDGGMILGVNTLSEQPWEDEIYVLGIGPGGSVTTQGPFAVHSGGCQLITDGAHLVCTEYREERTLLRVVSLDSGATVAEREISSGDYFHPNGLLEDWAPRS